ncbi:hypothetical protein DAPPUDRAFT_334481 [Daphnia pulex]|uniref:Uncharacterized protein n=1 Tax=Daphnia pulex TaxID=6669 RepID=E9HVM7_DAPPU|nr:hypothetical protein DAPPUDRAFT_334481 [Daphnia pulex]|eukprot:EFX64206.1 hypothetical protein DAPPUDRAFT_334481 [Daphnia pulex]
MCNLPFRCGDEHPYMTESCPNYPTEEDSTEENSDGEHNYDWPSDDGSFHQQVWWDETEDLDYHYGSQEDTDDSMAELKISFAASTIDLTMDEDINLVEGDEGRKVKRLSDDRTESKRQKLD